MEHILSFNRSPSLECFFSERETLETVKTLIYVYVYWNQNTYKDVCLFVDCCVTEFKTFFRRFILWRFFL